VDGLVVPGLFPPDVLGTRDFMAPEVVATADGPKEKRELPKRTTDLHALAVLIYQYLLHRHPLRGGKVYSVETEVQESLEMGEKALFVEHPTDSSNRPKVGKSDNVCLPWIDVAKVPYKTTGPYLTELFNQAFVDGLHDPSRRPAAGDWEDALVKTTDLVLRCDNPNCVMKWFVYDNKTRPICPYCGTRYKKTAPIFDFYTSYHGGSYRPENRRMMIFDGQYLYLWHIDRNIAPNERLSNEDQKPVGYFSFYNNAWVFVNQRLPDLKNISTGELIPPGKGVTLTDKLWLLLSAKETGRAVYVRITNC
jgi:serine/threonine protein kinase